MGGVDKVQALFVNGDWYTLLRKEILSLGGLERYKGKWI
jgi:hypothetical protein